MVDAGNSCISRSNVSGTPDVTTMLRENPVPVNGTITQWCVYTTAGTIYIKLKVFRDGGTDWVYVGESSQETVSSGGLHTFSTSIAVLTGDYVGFYITADSTEAVISADGTGGSNSSKYGDITSDTAKSGWGTGSTLFSVGAYIPGTNIYVNSSAGNDTYAGDSCTAGHPVLTFAKAYSLLASGGTIHICNSGADFSAETITLNKSYNTDLNGADGYWYGPQGS